MLKFSKRICSSLVLFLGLQLLTIFNVVYAQGLSLTGAGAVNRSFGGAAVASPIDAAGALHWNPAAISGLKQSQLEASVEVLAVDAKLGSRIDALGLSGSTSSTASDSVIPNLAVVFKDPSSNFTYGVGLLAVGGFSVDYPLNPTNPISAPPAFGGLGAMKAKAEVMHLTPTLAYQVDPKLSIGIAPVIGFARVKADPLFLAPPNANGTYATGADDDTSIGGGVQVGAYYQATDTLNLGASVKSPVWYDDFDFETTDASGAPRNDKLALDYPLIASIGAGYTGMERTLIGIDVRYFDWASADGFGDEGYAATGAVNGFGWDSIFSVATGIQYQATDELALRLGYNYAENPISSDMVMFNVISPLIFEHIAGAGLSYKVTQDVVVSLAYLYGFENTVRGPINLPGVGAVPGTEVSSTVSAHAGAISLGIMF